MCEVHVFYKNGSEEIFEGEKIDENGTIILQTRDGVKEIPKKNVRILIVEKTKKEEKKSPHEA
jgi:hypothetical protein